MSNTYRSWSGPARALALGIDAAVGAAGAADAEAFDASLGELRRIVRRPGGDREQLLVLLGAASLDLLERAAPDGLDAESAERVLRGCLSSAAPWYPALDSDALLRAFTASVGVADPDEPDAADGPGGDGPGGADGADEPRSTVTQDAVLAHGLLLVAFLCTSTGTPLPEVLDRALGELRRAQTVELP